MLSSRYCSNGMVVAPHHLAAETGLAALRDGGNAAEAAVATAAALAVVYPHMNGIGGDSFWLLRDEDGVLSGIDACGRAGAAVTPDLYRESGLAAIPQRGPLAANTVAGTIDGWRAVLAVGRRWAGRMPLARLLEEAIDHARNGCPMAESLAETLNAVGESLAEMPGFTAISHGPGRWRPGAMHTQPALADTLNALAHEGLDGFYRGAVAAAIADDLAAVGSPLTGADMADHHGSQVTPLSVALSIGRAHNLPPPTQGAASLIILALYDRLRDPDDDDTALVHKIVQATTRAYRLRDRHIGDPAAMAVAPADWLGDDSLRAMADGLDLGRVMPWDGGDDGGDTVWFGVIDGDGRAVSAIQSIFWEFGSGVVLPRTGILWQNRGSSFTLGGEGPRQLVPGRKPFHTLNPAMAELDDGRLVVYGAMGGDGQPQTQAALLARLGWHGDAAQASVTAPRWLMGKTWGDDDATLKLEARFGASVTDALGRMGYPVRPIGDFDPVMGHAGMLVRHPDGTLEGGVDPRSDGTVATF